MFTLFTFNTRAQVIEGVIHGIDFKEYGIYIIDEHGTKLDISRFDSTGHYMLLIPNTEKDMWMILLAEGYTPIKKKIKYEAKFWWIDIYMTPSKPGPYHIDLKKDPDTI